MYVQYTVCDYKVTITTSTYKTNVVLTVPYVWYVPLRRAFTYVNLGTVSLKKVNHVLLLEHCFIVVVWTSMAQVQNI